MAIRAVHHRPHHSLICWRQQQPEQSCPRLFYCNRRKSNRSDSLDPQTGIAVALFDPRRDRWSDHFIWARESISLIGLTPKGRSTIALLDLNRSRILAIRAADREINRHPPATDPIQS